MGRDASLGGVLAAIRGCTLGRHRGSNWALRPPSSSHNNTGWQAVNLVDVRCHVPRCAALALFLFLHFPRIVQMSFPALPFANEAAAYAGLRQTQIWELGVPCSIGRSPGLGACAATSMIHVPNYGDPTEEEPELMQRLPPLWK